MSNTKQYIFLILFCMLSSFLQSFLSIEAESLPTPMSESELKDNSDLFVRINVKKITKHDSVCRKSNTLGEIYVAQSSIIKIQNTKLLQYPIINICWRELPNNGMIGGWKVNLVENEIADIYLKYDDQYQCYFATSWNAKTDPYANNQVVYTN